MYRAYTNFNVTTWLQGVLSTGIGLHLDIEIVHSVSTSHRYGMNAERTVKIMAHTSKKSSFYFVEFPISRVGLERNPCEVGRITTGMAFHSFVTFPIVFQLVTLKCIERRLGALFGRIIKE